MASPLRTALRQQHQHLRTRFTAPRRFASSSRDQARKSIFPEASELTTQEARRRAEALQERTSSALSAYSEALVYKLSVAREFLKLVYRGERLGPPTSPQTVFDAYTTLAQRARNPAYWREIAQSGEWMRVGLYAIEAYGIFKIGEIIGRRSLVGYKVQ